MLAHEIGSTGQLTSSTRPLLLKYGVPHHTCMTDQPRQCETSSPGATREMSMAIHRSFPSRSWMTFARTSFLYEPGSDNAIMQGAAAFHPRSIRCQDRVFILGGIAFNFRTSSP